MLGYVKDQPHERVRGAVRSQLPFALLLFLAPGPLVGAEPPAGLILRLEAGGASDVRSAPGVALFVRKGQTVSPFLKAGPFKATWEGNLVLEKRSRLVFSMEGTGQARLLIDGEVVVDAIGKANDSKRIKSGEHGMVVEYESPAAGDAQLRMFWEGRDFSREPVPGSALTHAPGDDRLRDRTRLREGRAVLAEKRCMACHKIGGSSSPAMVEMTLKAPALDGVGKRLRKDWLAKWIANPNSLRPSAHMPVVFKKNAERSAADIAAYLTEGVSGIAAAPQAAAAQIKNGGHLFHEQGCIACHTLDSTGDGARIGLKSIGKKYRPGALADFLREPAKFHPASRMPDFRFTDEEATTLAGFLRSLENDPGASGPAGDAENGKKLFSGSGCLSCHERGEEKSVLPFGPPLNKLTQLDCKEVTYSLNDEERAVWDFLKDETAHASLTRSVPAEFAHRQRAALRCNACHAEDGEESLREKYASEVEHLKPPEPPAEEEKPAIKTGPPPLNHLGLKLRPEWRTKLFAGRIDPKVRKWMAARMPAFPTRAAPLSAGFSHAAGLPAVTPKPAALDPARVEVGEALASVEGGLACGTCHGIGEKPAIAVFEGEGPNFRDAGARLRREFFHLWMTDPPRLWPGTIMPKYAIEGKTPLTQHYEGDATRQFDAIYDYLRSVSEDQ